MYREYRLPFPNIEINDYKNDYIYEQKKERQESDLDLLEQKENVKTACEKYNSQLEEKKEVAYIKPSTDLFAPSRRDNDKLEQYPLWQHIWLDYYDYEIIETPIMTNPEFLFHRYFFPEYKHRFRHCNSKTGKEVWERDVGDFNYKTDSDVSSFLTSCSDFEYEYDRGRLKIDEDSPVPLCLINDLVVKVVKNVANKLAKNEYHYVEVKDRA